MFPSIRADWAKAVWISALGRHSCVLQHQTGISLWLLFVSLYLCVETQWTPFPPLDPEQSGAPRRRTTSFNDLRRIIWERIPVREGKMHLDRAHFPHRDWDGEAAGGVMLWTMCHGPNWFWFCSGCKIWFMTPLWKFYSKLIFSLLERGQFNKLLI